MSGAIDQLLNECVCVGVCVFANWLDAKGLSI